MTGVPGSPGEQPEVLPHELAGCGPSCGDERAEVPAVRDADWLRAARAARLLSWVSLVWMTMKGAVGLYSGIVAGSVALIGWALSSVVEGLASIIVIWRFTGNRTLSETAERQAQRAVAVSFWMLAPYVAVESIRDLLTGHRPETSLLGIVVTALSLLIMPPLGRAKHKLGERLDSEATAGEGTQNVLCAYLAAAVLAGLGANTLFGWWWLDPLIGLVVAGVAVVEGLEAWNGDDCC